MNSLSLFQEFDITLFESEKWDMPPHQHSFFEIVYILEGKGIHILNNNGFEYSKGSLYLLTPNDEHSFQITEKTSFCIITFNKIYFSKEKTKGKNTIDFSELFKKLELIFSNANYLIGDSIKNNEERNLVSILIHQIIEESKTKSEFFESIIQNSIFLILNIIARNIQNQLTSSFRADTKSQDVNEIVFYIQQHIYDKEKLKIDQIADHFSKSANYVSQYFKEQTGNSIKDYIQQYKLNLIKNRLQFSSLSISQIADEFGFTDESHLNKTFKLTFGQTTKAFRIENKA